MMKKRVNGSNITLDRKIIEKNRRTHMKNLCYQLNSLIPSLFSQPYKIITQENQFNESVVYIEQLRKRVEGLKEKRDELSRMVNNDGENKSSGYNVENDHSSTVSCDSGGRFLTVEVKELDGGLQVLLTTKSQRSFSLANVVRIVEDGGAAVVQGGLTTVGDKVFYTLHAQAKVPRIGVDITSIHERLQELSN